MTHKPRTTDHIENDEMNSTWRKIIWQQFGAAIDMFENALTTCPEGLRTGSLWNDNSQRPEFSEFWYIAYHTLFWLDYYLSGTLEGYSPPAPFTLDEMDPAGLLPERQYTRSELLTYLDHDQKNARQPLKI